MSTRQPTETEEPRRSVRIMGLVVTGAAVLFWIGVMTWIQWYTTAVSTVQYGVAFLGGILTVYALDEVRQSLAEGDATDAWVLLASAGTLIVSALYFGLNFNEVYVVRQGFALEHEYFLAQLVVLSILYLTWREFGNLFLGLVLAGIGYAYFGAYIPGILGHGGISRNHMLQMLVTDLHGFYGSLTQLTASWIAPFLLYAGLLFGYGAFGLILRVAIRSARYIESGVAQTAVLASAVIGSINGSYTANAGMTGSFTIPTMKDAGMRGRTAAGIEAVASTSGQVLPPVMGASAFVMASNLQMAYIDVVIAGLVPATILVGCIVIAVHYTATTEAGDQSMEFSEFFDDPLTTVEKVTEGIRFGVPFVVLIYYLGIRQITVMRAALYTVVAMIVLGVTVPVLGNCYRSLRDGRLRMTDAEAAELAEEGASESRLVGPDAGRLLSLRPLASFAREVENTIHGFRRGAIILAPIAIILAAINGVVDLFNVTGVPSKIALVLLDLSGGVLLVAIVISMAICIVMGVGMPTVAAYVIVAVLVAPPLVNDFGVVELAAHYTVFYAAVLAGITPPVATAAVVTAGLARANFWSVCAVAIKIAAPLFVLPIAFIYHPELVSTSIDAATVWAGTLTLAGAVATIYGLNYPFEIAPDRRFLVRGALFAGGVVVMVHPNALVQVAGALAFVAVFAAEKVLVRGWTVPGRRGVEQ